MGTLTRVFFLSLGPSYVDWTRIVWNNGQSSQACPWTNGRTRNKTKILRRSFWRHEKNSLQGVSRLYGISSHEPWSSSPLWEKLTWLAFFFSINYQWLFAVSYKNLARVLDDFPHEVNFKTTLFCCSSGFCVFSSKYIHIKYWIAQQT